MAGWNWIRAYGIAATVASLLLAAYYGFPKLRKAFYEYMDIFIDSKVRRFLDSQRTEVFRTVDGPVEYGIPKTTTEISNGARVSMRLIPGSLGRLRDKNLVVIEKDGKWRAAHR